MIRRHIAAVFMCAAFAFAQAAQPPSADVLSAIATRGKMLYEYDLAVWHATDAMHTSGVQQDAVDRYVARKTESGWVVTWGRFTNDHDTFLINYEAIQGAKADEFAVKKHDPAIRDSGFYLHAARAIETARQDFHGEARPYNFAVLPGNNGKFYVYVVPAQTIENVYPVGGDVRYLISSDGLVTLDKRRMHQDIIDFAIRPTSVFSLHTHILSDTPEDSDVFDVLTRKPRIPEYIPTCHFTYMVQPEGSIQSVELAACGKRCEDYVAKLPSFQSFRRSGCPDLAPNP